MDLALQSFMAKKASAFMKRATLAPSLGAVMQSPFTIKSQKIKGPDEKPPGKGLMKYADKGDGMTKADVAKIVGGVAMATAAGVGAKLLHSHWKGRKLPKTVSTRAHLLAEKASK
jgi:hypothetical protein